MPPRSKGLSSLAVREYREVSLELSTIFFLVAFSNSKAGAEQNFGQPDRV